MAEFVVPGARLHTEVRRDGPVPVLGVVDLPGGHVGYTEHPAQLGDLLLSAGR
jgi:hypothetical protein